MYKPFMLLVFLVWCVGANAQNPSRRYTGTDRAIIDAKEVADPTLNKTELPKTNDAGTLLKKLPATAGSVLGRIMTTTSYLIIGFEPKTNEAGVINMTGISNIKLVNALFDNGKVGFSPVGNDLQKKGYTVLGLQIEKTPVDWLKQKLLEKTTGEDPAFHRQLVMVLNKLWFSNSAVDHYTASRPRLLTTLYYDLDLYTSLDIGYYPQTKLTGALTVLYNDGNAYNILADSLLSILAKEAFTNGYAIKETESNWISPVDFNDHYNQRFKRLSHPENMPKGLYTTYEDFVQRKPASDSVEMIVKYNNYERAPNYACQLTAYKAGEVLSCNRAWGYYDGVSLFVNTGNGFFIKLIRTKEDFVFYYLKNIREERIKPDLQSSIVIGNSSYQVLKDYTKAFGLTYQLDYDTGKLY